MMRSWFAARMAAGAVCAFFLLTACGAQGEAADEQVPADQASALASDSDEEQDAGLPAGADEAPERLASSPRHGEWVTVQTGPADSVRAWVVYPERPDPVPVVLVVHEIFGLTNWVRGVADQLAADGFIAIAPDLLTMNDIPEGADGDPERDPATTEIRTLEPADVHRQLQAVAEYGMDLPAATRSYGIVGYCWGGGTSFQHVLDAPDVGASVVYYGSSPEVEDLSRAVAPVLGLYGGDDARVNATIPPADSAMQTLGKTYEYHIFDGAGHGFLRQQDGQDGANLAATQEAWPLTVAWFREHLEGS